MGASARKKREKKQDFQKTKLKVGKSKAKAANFTDTTFKAKSIILNQQSLSTAAPTADAAFAHNLSLVTSKTDSQRRDALAYMTNVVTEGNGVLPLPVATILPKVQPLILDISNSVRAQLTKLLRALPKEHIATHVDHMLLYVRAGMTHLAAKIRESTLDVLEWLLEIAPQELVSCAGGWLKTLSCFLTLLGWQNTDSTGAWSSARASFGKPGSAEAKLLVKQLNILTMFLRAGFTDANTSLFGNNGSSVGDRYFPLCCGAEHEVLFARSNPFRSLNLFGAPKDAENTMYDDAEARKRSFDGPSLRAVARGIQNGKKEGGDVGRAASYLEKVLVDGMGDFDREME